MPRPTASEIASFYAEMQQANEWEQTHYVEPRQQHRDAQGRVVEKYERLLGGTKTLLEIGPAAGWLLQAARERGWQVAGIEAAPKFQRDASETLGLPVRLGTIGQHAAAFEEFADLIVLRDVLEHLYDPVSDLRRVARRLRPGGCLVVETPNIESVAARFYDLRWRQIVCSHAFCWTRKSLSIALSRAGLSPVYWSEPRYWDPDPRREQLNRRREISKLLVRIIACLGYVWPSDRWPMLRKLPKLLRIGRVDDSGIRWRVGEQPVLADVHFCIAAHADMSESPGGDLALCVRNT